MNWRHIAHSWLEIPIFYNGLQWFIGATKERAHFLQEAGPFHDGDKIVDIGCGTARILESLPKGVRYVGFDPNDAYIRQAQQRHHERGIFITGDAVTPDVLREAKDADVVMSLGVLHHLTDGQIEDAFALARDSLKPSGRMIVYEPCFTDHDDPIGKFLMRLDRGQNVKHANEWRAIAARHFKHREETIRKPVLLLRYTIQTLICRNQ